MASQERRKSSRMRWKPGPFRKPATVMKQTIPVQSTVSGRGPNTFQAAQRQK
jgi:hypothetical protein